MNTYKYNCVIFIPSLLGVILTFLCLFPAIASAETVVRGGDTVSISSGQLVEDDLYAYGGTVTNSGIIEEDMYAIGGSVVVNGLVGTDLTVIGGSTQVYSTIGDDARIVTGEAVIGDEIKGDLFVIAGVLNLLSSAKVDGNVYFYGGQANIDGAVNGSVMGTAERFNLNGSVGGGVDVQGMVDLGDTANITGDLHYSSVQELSRAQNAVVEGTISRADIMATPTTASDLPMMSFIIWSFTSLAVYLLFRRNLGSISAAVRKDLAKSLLFGLIALMLIPVVSVILMVTILGVWFGIMTLLAWLALLITSIFLLPIVVGDQIMTYIKPRPLNWYVVLLGVLVTVAVSHIPYIGGLLLFLSIATVAGHLLLALYSSIRDKI